jgi:hypothetical protein
MARRGSYQLPEGIQMPEAYAQSISHQLWFYEGAKTAVEGHKPRNADEVRQGHGKSIAAAYQAGYAAGAQKKENATTPEGVPIPVHFARSPLTKKWFSKGAADALRGGLPKTAIHFPHRYMQGLAEAKAYKAGYSAGEQLLKQRG